MFAPRFFIPMLVLSGLIAHGCSSGTKNNPEATVAINQLSASGLKEGPWEIYDDSVLIARGNYVDDLADGLWTCWYPNGQMKEEGHYSSGIKTGMWVEWYPDGVIMWKGEWVDGTRKITDNGARAEVVFRARDYTSGVLHKDSLYQLKIRIQNIPSRYLFVEVSSGEIRREGADSDQFILRTSSDTMLTMAIGYMPDLEFEDFRNLVSEIDYKLE